MKIVFYIIAAIVGLYVLAIILMYVFQDQFIFQGKKLAANYQFEFGEDHFEELFLTSTDGSKINALYFKSPEPSKGLVLYFHGNSSNLKRWGKEYKTFTRYHYDVLIIDFQTYGKSGGKASEKRIYEDGKVAYEWAKARYSTNDVVLYGRSLGAAVATQLATEVDAKMLILETPFSEIAEVFEYRMFLPKLPFPLKSRFSNIEKIPQVPYPIHIFHGTNDRIVPYKIAKQLKPVLKAKDSFTTLENGTHRNLTTFEEYQEKLKYLLED